MDGYWVSTVMETKDDYVNCLAFSPDNHRIFNGGDYMKILIHDAQTLDVQKMFIFLIFSTFNLSFELCFFHRKRLLNTLTHPKRV